jgi:hypothetical protein
MAVTSQQWGCHQPIPQPVVLQHHFGIKLLVDYYRTNFVPRTLILKASVQPLQQQIAWNELLPRQVSLALTLAALGLPVGVGF